jgi:SOS response regulatory protein OraA/RecX
MFDFLSKLNGGEIIGLAAVIAGPMVAIVAVIATQWRRVRVAEFEATLKQQMLDKGMSAAEIEQVMRASQDPAAAGPVASTGNGALDKAALAQRMVDEGYEGKDIERVLKAYQPGPQPSDEKSVANQA